MMAATEIAVLKEPEQHCKLCYSDIHAGKVGLAVKNDCLRCYPTIATLRYHSILVELFVWL